MKIKKAISNRKSCCECKTNFKLGEEFIEVLDNSSFGYTNYKAYHRACLIKKIKGLKWKNIKLIVYFVKKK